MLDMIMRKVPQVTCFLNSQLQHSTGIWRTGSSSNIILQNLRFFAVLVEGDIQNTAHRKGTYNDLDKLKERNDKLQKKLLAVDKVPLQNDPDKFGTLSSESLLRNRLENLYDEDEQELVEFIDGKEGKTKLKTIEYSKIISNCLREKNLKKALDVLEIRMLEDHAKPDDYIFRLLISGCAKVGYTKKAFQLFNQMKKRGLKVKENVYTSLFDACANSPWPSDGIKRANDLWELMVTKRVVLNQKIAHAAIKAFGRCGDIERAFTIVDEMDLREVPMSSETINFLLQACASEKEAGFRHSLIVWRKMLDRKIIPTTYTYNLLLRCTRDCFIGNMERFKEDLPKLFSSRHEEVLSLMSPAETEFQVKNNFCSDGLELRRKSTPTSNLQTQIISVNLGKLVKPWHRLMILGGQEGFLNMMLKTGAEPDIKTFTQLLFIIAPCTDQDQLLITEMKRLGIKMDLDFCNLLIKKRSMNSNYKEAKEVLSIIKEEHLIPNIVTFGVLAMGCSNLRDIKRLRRDVEAVGLRLNIQILGTLLGSSCRSWDFKAIDYLVRLLTKLEIKPNFMFIEHLQKLNQEIINHIDRKEKGVTHCNKLESSSFKKDYADFKQLIIYVKSLEVEDPSTVHPWNQFKRRTLEKGDYFGRDIGRGF